MTMLAWMMTTHSISPLVVILGWQGNIVINAQVADRGQVFYDHPMTESETVNMDFYENPKTALKISLHKVEMF